MARKKERPLNLLEQPGLVFRARFLTQIDTVTLLEAVVDPAFNTRATRTIKALMLAELCYRVSRREYKPRCFSIYYDDVGMTQRVWADVFGPRVPVPPGFGAPSAYFLHDRAWAALDAELH